jgi:GAF domain-containing protein
MGALVIGFAEARRFDPDDIALLHTFADQCAIALERARLYREAEEARDRWAFLAAVSTALGHSLDLETMLSNLVDVVVPRVADWAAVHLVESQRLRSVHARHLTPERTERFRAMLADYPPRFDGPIGPGAVIRTGRPSIFPQLGLAELYGLARDPEHFALLRDIGFGSAAYLPLLVSGRVQGVLVLGRDTGSTLTPDDVKLAEEIASRASTALQNALLYQERFEIARALQASLLPPSLPVIEGLDLAARYSPAGSGADVGGDFYDIKRVSPECWFAVVGDVCGTGIKAASMTGLARHALRSAALEHRQPSEILGSANELLVRDANDRGDANRPSPRFCTVVALQLERNEGGFELTVCCAGHPQPVLMDHTGQTRAIGTEGTLLGVFEEVTLHDVSVQLRPGDTLVAFTDGVTERRRSSK